MIKTIPSEVCGLFHLNVFKGSSESVSQMQLLSLQSGRHVLGGGESKEHLWSAIHWEWTVEEVCVGADELELYLTLYFFIQTCNFDQLFDPLNWYSGSWSVLWMVWKMVLFVISTLLSMYFRNIPTIRKRFDDVCKTGYLDQDKRLFV